MSRGLVMKEATLPAVADKNKLCLKLILLIS